MSVKLKPDAVSFADAITMAVAGSAPAYSLSTVTAALVAAVALAGPGALLYAALPMLGITIAYTYLNRWRPDSGTVYSWVGRSMNPTLGFMAGWACLLSFVLFFAAAAVPAGSATLYLFSPHLAENVHWTTTIGAFWFAAVALLTMLGISVTTKFQKVMTGIEVVALAVLGIGALVKFAGHPVQAFSWHWFSPAAFGGIKPFMAGMLVAVFYYYGWDVSSNLSEETENPKTSPGAGGVIGTLIVIALFLLVQIGVQMGLTSDEIANNSANILPYLGDKLLPHPWSAIAVFAVMLSTIATMETTLMQANRTLFSMGRARVMWPKLAELHARYQTPWLATFVLAAVSLALIFLSGFSVSVGALIANLVSAVGLMVVIYYGLSGLACFWYYRKTYGSSPESLWMKGIWPLASAIFLFTVGAMQIVALDHKVVWWTLAVYAAGLIPLLHGRFQYKSAFYTGPRESAGVNDGKIVFSPGAVTVPAEAALAEARD